MAPQSQSNLLQTENSCSPEKDQIAARIKMAQYIVGDMPLCIINTAKQSDELASFLTLQLTTEFQFVSFLMTFSSSKTKDKNI